MTLPYRLRLMWDSRGARRNPLLATRRHLLALGIDTSGLSDDDLAARIVSFGRVAAKSGVSAQQATDALWDLARVAPNS